MSALALVRSTPAATASDVHQMKAKLVDYWNAVAIINANSFAIVKTQLSKIDEGGEIPQWWTTLSGNFESCRSHAQYWIDTVYPSLTRVPQTIIAYNTFFSVTSKSIVTLLKAFAGRQPTAAEKLTIQAKLNLLLTQLGTSKSQVEAVRADIKTFTDRLDEDRKALTTGAASVTKALGVDEAKVKKINKLIEELRAEVTALEVKLGLSTFGMTASIMVGYAVGGPFGLVIGIIGAGVSIALIVVFTVKMQQKNDEIEAETKKLGPLARRIVSLNVIDSSVKQLAKAIDEINASIDVVAKTWETLESDLGDIVTKLTSARDEDWADIIQKGIDMGAAQEAWKNLDKFAKDLQKVAIVFDETPHPLKGAA